LLAVPSLHPGSNIARVEDARRRGAPLAGGEKAANAAGGGISGEAPELNDEPFRDHTRVVRSEPVVVEKLRREPAIAEGITMPVVSTADAHEGHSPPCGDACNRGRLHVLWIGRRRGRRSSPGDHSRQRESATGCRPTEAVPSRSPDTPGSISSRSRAASGCRAAPRPAKHRCPCPQTTHPATRGPRRGQEWTLARRVPYRTQAVRPARGPRRVHACPRIRSLRGPTLASGHA
jgi:hypothetical protein